MKNNFQSIIDKRKIEYLIHFTQLSNLESILNNGIYPRSKLDLLDITVEINDHLRLDNHEDSSSLSISFPNYKMFYGLRMDSDVQWCVLVMNPKILYIYDCAFCKHNAADTKISNLDIKDLKNSKSLEEMFEEINNHSTRKEQLLKDYYPTDVQAEVLVFDIISRENILAVIFNDKEEKDNFDKTHKNMDSYYHGKNGFFSERNYFIKKRDS